MLLCFEHFDGESSREHELSCSGSQSRMVPKTPRPRSRSPKLDDHVHLQQQRVGFVAFEMFYMFRRSQFQPNASTPTEYGLLQLENKKSYETELTETPYSN